MDEFDESGTISRRRVEDILDLKIGNLFFFFFSFPLLLTVTTEFKGGGEGDFGNVKRHACAAGD